MLLRSLQVELNSEPFEQLDRLSARRHRPISTGELGLQSFVPHSSQALERDGVPAPQLHLR